MLKVPWNTRHSYSVLVFGVRSRTEVFGAVLWLEGLAHLGQALPFCCKCGVAVPLSHRKGLWKVWFSPPRAVGPAFLFGYWNGPSWAVEIRGCVLNVLCLEAGRLQASRLVMPLQDSSSSTFSFVKQRLVKGEITIASLNCRVSLMAWLAVQNQDLMMSGAVCDCLFKQLELLNNSLASSMLFSRHTFMRETEGKATKRWKLSNLSHSGSWC